MIPARSRRWTILGVPVAILVAATALTAGFGRAGAVHENASLPGHIHSGTCEDLGDVVYPLTNASMMGLMQGMMGGTPEADAEPIDVDDMIGAEEATTALSSYTVVDASLEDIVEGGHAINFHESAENIQNYVACGEIGGFLQSAEGMDEGALVIGLRRVNESIYSGTAALVAIGDQTEVYVYLAPNLAGAPAAAQATPDAEGDDADAEESAAASDAVEVDIEDFVYDPDPIEIPVGGTVNWTNQDGVPHTATATDQDVLQSGTLNQGDTYSQTFDEAGEYEYHCEFHAQMNGTIVVQ